MKVTDIQRFKYDYGTSYNFAIDNDWMIQLDTDGTFSIPSPGDAYWNNEDAQDKASDEYSADEIANLLSLREMIEDPETGYDNYDRTSLHPPIDVD